MSRCFLRQVGDSKNVLLSGKRVGDRDASNLLSILKVFTVKNFALTFDQGLVLLAAPRRQPLFEPAVRFPRARRCALRRGHGFRR